MNVLLVSQCDKRALRETRRIIDQFAERRGSRTWQTAITQAGLETLRAMLRRTARKNTAVACHWIRGADHTELLWIVGDASRFNAVGATPTNTTSRDVLRVGDEHPWIHAEAIKLIAAMAALFHDFGKANDWFQEKLRKARAVADPLRHEWISLKLFQAFVAGRSDEEWLQHLADLDRPIDIAAADAVTRARTFAELRSPIACAVGWLIVSHHRLPARSDAGFQALNYVPGSIEATWGYSRDGASADEYAACRKFSRGLPVASRDWRRRAAKAARSLLQLPGATTPSHPKGWVHDPYAMAVGRLALVVADHHYSRLPSQPRYGDPDFPLYANTDRKSGSLKQRLDEHLVGVASHTRRVVGSLLHIDRDLPRIARHRGFKKRTTNERFRWQDRAFDLASSLSRMSHERGFFGVNMASTGCGKTLANGRIAYALSDPSRGTRFTIALGLRTLTLQTGDAYRSRLGLGQEDLAVVIGSRAVRDLHEAARDARERADEPSTLVPGSESAEPLLDQEIYVHFAANVGDGPLSRWLQSSDALSFVHAPVLVCTIDHLMAACEATRGGHHVAPLLRLMTSDLILDEPDDFDIGDLPALTRLVFTAGMMGSRVLLSSATLPPALVGGLFEAYAEGRAHFQRHQRSGERDSSIPCAWFDEFGAVAEEATVATFRDHHDAFAARRARKLAGLPRRRTLEIIPFPVLPGTRGRPADRRQASRAFADLLPEAIPRLHDENHVVDDAGRRVSFGLVRVANVDPLIDVAAAFRTAALDSDWHVFSVVYHSRFPLLMRSAVERLLDEVLQRADPRRCLAHPRVRRACAETEARNVVFVVLASPVAEVGRDHDYDWAVVEPSSLRSLIQLVGRVRRHRPEAYDRTNVLVLERNLRAAANLQPAYVRPGYETAGTRLSETSVSLVLRDEERERIDSAPRIVERSELAPTKYFADLEHHRMRAVFGAAGRDGTAWHAGLVWKTSAHLTGLVQQRSPFRASQRQTTYAWRVDEDTGDLVFCRKEPDGTRWKDVLWTPQEELVSRIDLAASPRVTSWGPSSYRHALEETSALLDRADLGAVAERYGTVELYDDDVPRGWRYHDTLGFRRRDDEE